MNRKKENKERKRNTLRAEREVFRAYVQKPYLWDEENGIKEVTIDVHVVGNNESIWAKYSVEEAEQVVAILQRVIKKAKKANKKEAK